MTCLLVPYQELLNLAELMGPIDKPDNYFKGEILLFKFNGEERV
jgi:hypothetical protein